MTVCFTGNRPLVKFIENYIWHLAGAHCIFQILTNEDIRNFTDIMFEPNLNLVVYDKNILRSSLKVLSNLQNLQ